MARYEFRLLNGDGKATAITYRECASEDEAVQEGLRMMAGHRFVEIWVGSKSIARFPCH